MKVSRTAYDVLEGLVPKSEVQKRDTLRTLTNFWLKANHEQRVRLSTKAILEEDDRFLRKWYILLQNTNLSAFELLKCWKKKVLNFLIS